MPPEDCWETFFHPSSVLESLGLNRAEGTIVDVGAGYGTFALAAAHLTGRQVVAIDIEPNLIASLARRAKAEQLGNLNPFLRDVVAEGIGLPDGSADIVLLFNILHCERPNVLLQDARRTLRPGGRVGVLHWRSDVPTPRGPSLDIRPTPDQCAAWLREAGFDLVAPPQIVPPYHFGLVGQKPEAGAE